MSWLYVPGMPDCPSDSELLSLDLALCAWWRGKPSPPRTWLGRLKRAPWTTRLSGLTSPRSTGDRGVESLISSLARGYPASPSAQPVADSAPPTLAGSGPMSSGLSRSASPRKCSSKTSPDLCVADLPPSYKDLPASASLRNGICSARPRLAHLTSAKGCSSSLPTPAASPYGSSGNGCPGDGREEYAHKGTPSLETLARKGLLPTPTRPPLWPTPRTITGGAESAERKQEPGRTASGGGDLQAAVKMWPTPNASAERSFRLRGGSQASKRNLSSLARQGEMSPVGGALNPEWVEWLMGLPTGWISCEVSETELFRFVRRMRIELSLLVSASQYLETEDLLE